MIDFGVCKEHILTREEASAPMIVRAEAYWQGLSSALGRTPKISDLDAGKINEDGRLTALVRLFPGHDDVAYESVGRTLRHLDGDFQGKRLSEMRAWPTAKLILGHYKMVAG